MVLNETASSRLSERGTWKHKPVKYVIVALISVNYSFHLWCNTMNGAASAICIVVFFLCTDVFNITYFNW